MSLCEWCGIRYEPTNAEQRYCTRTHSVRAGKVRNNPPESYAICPTPGKRSYDTVADAAGNRATLRDPTMRIYRCLCGKYHHGHDSKTAQKRRTNNQDKYRIYYRPTTIWSRK